MKRSAVEAPAQASSSTAPARQQRWWRPEQQAPNKRARCSLEEVLSDVDAALHLSANACAVATHLCTRSSDAAERVLSLAEAALAATMQQLAHAQELVAHQLMVAAAQQQHGADRLRPAAADPDLLDTCSSSFAGQTTTCCAAV